MSEHQQVSQRIVRALDRITKALDQDVPLPAGHASELETFRLALREAQAQSESQARDAESLRARLRSVEEQRTAAQAQRNETAAQGGGAEAEVQRLRNEAAQLAPLRARVAELEAAVAKGTERTAAQEGSPDRAPSPEETVGSSELAALKAENAELKTHTKTLKGRVRNFRRWSVHHRDQYLEAVERLEATMQALREANAVLRDNNRQLREANAEGLADPVLINQSLQVELEAVRADRDLEQAQMAAMRRDLEGVLENHQREIELMSAAQVLDDITGDDLQVEED